MAVANKKLQRPLVEQRSAMCQSVLDAIDADRQNLQPTPLIGDIIGWTKRYRRQPGQKVEWRPAIVTQILGPGRIRCEAFGEPQKVVVDGAIYIHHPDNLSTPSLKVSEAGGWFYREIITDASYQPPKSAFLFHKEALDRREQLCLEDEERRVQQAMERDKFKQQNVTTQPAAAQS